MTLTMYDSASPEGIPSDATIVAGYVDGGDYDQLLVLFPHATHFSITASNPPVAADCLDVEGGDAQPDQAAAWVEDRIRAGQWRPCVYASIDNYMPDVIDALAHLKRSSYRLWVAHWTPANPPSEVPEGYDAVQWLSTPEYDRSLLLDDFFAPKPPPPPKYPTLTAEQKKELTAVREDLLGIIAHKGQLTKTLDDQGVLAKQRLNAIF